MENKINKEISDIIEKNLPAQVGKVLQEVLEQGKKDALSVENLSKELLNAVKNLKEKDKTIEHYREKDSEYRDIKKKEVEVLERERMIEIKELTYCLEAEKEKTAFAKSLALGLVRNTEYKKSIFGNENIPSKDQYGNTTTMYGTNSKTESNTAE